MLSRGNIPESHYHGAVHREEVLLEHCAAPAGIRVLTFENLGAGPFGSPHLADLGAGVATIENREPGGDATRGMGPFFQGPHDGHFFQTANLNKIKRRASR